MAVEDDVRVVVTGATGNVGTSVVDALLADDEVTEVVGLARRPTDWHDDAVRWVPTDVLRDDLTPTFRGADAVVHLAWIFQPTHSPLKTWENNVHGSRRVFEAVAEAGVSALVHASSVGAYSPGPSDRPVDESWPTHAWPTAGYGREKSYVERLLDLFERDHPDVRVVRLRPGFIFQRPASEAQRRIFAGPFLPNALVRRSLIPVIPDVPGLRFQTLHARDAAEAYRLAVRSDVRGPFNVAADPVVDAAALASMFDARVIRVPRPVLRGAVAALWHLHVVPASPQLVDLFLSLPVMDTTRARTELGWEPTVDSLGALQVAIDGIRDAASGPTPPLQADAGGRARMGEVGSGLGETGGVTDDGR